MKSEVKLVPTAEAVTFAADEGLDVMYVTEDTTRSRPETLKQLYTTAIECGARRICLADTVGHATPFGVRQLRRFSSVTAVTATTPLISFQAAPIHDPRPGKGAPWPRSAR